MQLAQGIDWGTVPAWFSAILSGGSVLLALHIILRDRKKAESADAMQVVCWKAGDNEYTKTHIINTSARAIHNVVVIAWIRPFGGSSAKEAAFEGYPAIGLLRPGEEHTLKIHRRQPDDSVKILPRGVRFQDSDGTTWVRDMESGSLARARERRFRLNRHLIWHLRQRRWDHQMSRRVQGR